MSSTSTHRAPLDLFKPVKPERAVDAALEQIVDLIQAGRIAADSLLPGERRLASAMKVSRRTVRDAIEILQDAGVLAVAPGNSGGARVASIWIPESLSGAGESPGLQEVFEALEARRVIEPRVAQLAALRGTSDDFDRMRQTIELQRAHQRDWWQVTQGNVLFHRLIWRAARNPDLESSMRAVYHKLSGPLYDILRRDQDLAATEESIDLHVETLDAMMRGKPDQVDEVMDRHLRYLEGRCEVMYGRPRFPTVPQFLIGGATGGGDSPIPATPRKTRDSANEKGASR